MPVKIYIWARLYPTILFGYAFKFFELSSKLGCVSSGHLKYHAKNSRSKKNISSKPFTYQCQHQLVTFIYTSLLYLTLIGNLESFPVQLIEALQKNIHLSGTNAGLCPELTLFLGKTKNTFPMQKNKFGGQFYKINRAYKQRKTSFYLKNIFSPPF